MGPAVIMPRKYLDYQDGSGDVGIKYSPARGGFKLVSVT